MTKIDTLWYTRCPVPTPLGIAAQQGLIEEEFAKDGIQVRTLQDVTDPTLRDSHYDHTLENSFRQGGNIPAIWARATGRATRVVGLTWTDEAQVILTLPQNKIPALGDLKGKRLGVLVNKSIKIDFWRATTLRAYVAALKLEGLTERDVKLVDLERSDTPQARTRGWAQGDPRKSPEARALLEGEVDAIFHKGSRGLGIARAIGAEVVFDLGKHPDPKVRVNNGSPRTLTVDAGLLEKHPDLAVRLLKRVLSAGRWAEANPREAIAYVARETGSTEEAVALAYGKDVGSHLQTDLLESSIAALSDFKDFLLTWGFLPHDFDVRGWIDPYPLTQARKELDQRQKVEAENSLSL
ncbi:MAG TPA: ABC transporter substrate-binding protein [Polyangiaceae bacterium]|jgi:ABC-type nitrate/sulfonate/bicarbonate transport system substrate-binding protein|nr:ABC transporter substrate-binding protein [Polyangiaceae bacterium]